MKKDRSSLKIKSAVILVVVIASLLLYMAGVFSGLLANKIIKKETEQNIEILKEKTQKDLIALKEYISFLDSNLKSMQFEDTFVKTLIPEKRCEFLRISLTQLVNQLGYYWDKLPYRIEEYEKKNALSEEYIKLRDQYSQLSIRIWILAKNQYEECNTNIVHGLYFYSVDCDNCVAQGEELDKLHERVTESGKEMIMFPINFDSDDIMIQNLKRFYSINATPAVIINDDMHQGRLFLAEELWTD
ncbi:hypothetical protein J4206_01825 [Candidatus Woesearchaeota archaeon]|nr:hypothetical protein [Candidatus Woesearchaeota archaeon]